MGSSQLALERLFELERGLRSSIREDQEKTLQSIPAFFDEFGDSQEAMMGLTLRLTDFFKSKGNERRLELTKFLELNCAKPLESLQEGGEEFGRRLISLWETNDSLLKSWFGLLSKSLGGLPEVLYRISQSLLAEGSREETASAIKVTIKIVKEQQGQLPSILFDPILFLIHCQLSEMSKYRQALIDLLKTAELGPEDSYIFWQFLQTQPDRDRYFGDLYEYYSKIFTN